MPPILNAQSVTKQFGAMPLFRNISFTVEDGDRIGLIGPNGAGKSTLLKILAGVDKNIIRLAPSLITRREDMDRGLGILEEAIKKVVIV